MSAEKNRWLTVGANLGVLAGILLVAFELAQNRELMRAQTRNEVSTQIVELLRDVSTDPQLADLLSRAGNGERLTPADSTQYQHRILAMLRYFENVHYQYRQELYDEVEFSEQFDAWRGFLGPAANARIWCNWRETFSPQFMTDFDSLNPHSC